MARAIVLKAAGGTGPDCLLLHGFASDHFSWVATSPALEACATLHTLDLPGHGETPLGDCDGSPLDLATAVEAALDSSGIGKTHIIGHSLGGGIALLMATRRPERVASLALIAPAGLGAGIDEDFVTLLPEADTTETALAQLQKLVARPQFIGKQLVQRVLAQLALPGARDALRAVARGVLANETVFSEAAGDCAALGIPRLTIWGEIDRINPLSEAKLQAFGGEHLRIEGAGHLPHVENAKSVNAGLDAFLRVPAA